MQVIVDNKINGFEEARKALAGSSFLVEGVIHDSPAKGQSIELHASNVQLLCGSDEK